MLFIFLLFFFLTAAGFCKALMDHSSEDRFRNTWLNKSSWLNKWKLDEFGHLIPYQGKPQAKYLWAFTPGYVERFYLSSSLFAFRTDGWHLFQLFFLLSISGAIAAIALLAGKSFLLYFLITRIAIGISFTLTRRFLLHNKN